MYDEKAKLRTTRYLKEKRDKLTLNLPLGDKDRYKSYAESKGQSLTSLLVELIEYDMQKSDFNYAAFLEQKNKDKIKPE